jgi:hypothetical protein
MTSRTVSSSAATSRAIADTGVPELEAMMIVARRTRIELPRPRRTIWVSVWPLGRSRHPRAATVSDSPGVPAGAGRLWQPRHTGKIARARELAELIAARYPDRTVHVVGEAATWENACATWTTGSPGPAG